MTCLGTRDPGSFRDPSAYVFHRDGRVLRGLSGQACESYLRLRSSKVYDALVEEHLLLEAEPVDEVDPLGVSACVVEQPAIPFISYPYEWPFSLLKQAALLHIDLQIRALDLGFSLSDASAYNVQFRGVQPIFIDIASLRPKRDREYWAGQRQFYQQFLNPLILTAKTGLPFQPLYRGTLEGLSSDMLVQMLGRHKWSWTAFLHVFLPAYLESPSVTSRTTSTSRREGPSARVFLHTLEQLRRLIAKLEFRSLRKSHWSTYTETNTYSDIATNDKLRCVSDFVARRCLRTIWDLGCNTGLYSKEALSAGAESVIGFDTDPDALEHAVQLAKKANLNFLPLLMDATNPSPQQGWNQAERRGLSERTRPDGLIALAFEHHLIITRNIPISMFLDWLVGLSPCGLVEFVPKSDPMIQQMLRFRDDIFGEYSEESFETSLTERSAKVVKHQVAGTERVIFEYEGNK
jgi:ribosomal protein L11 methylase PrmA